ncbi:MAG: fumarylacetoacetate hydrolase family protein [Planctomycetaceae bacterium]|nr:fumarylacetoacetate hydrolase family protein [Planctomycetaceae bacterium]
MSLRPVPVTSLTLALAVLAVSTTSHADEGVNKFARFQSGDTVSYGIVEGDRVRLIKGDLFGDWSKTDKTFALDDVTLLVPTTPTQVIALAGNYHSHIATGEKTVTTIVTTTTTTSTDLVTGKTTSNTTSQTEQRSSDEVPEKFRMPQPFFKSPSCLTPQDSNIVIPKEADTVHFEAELVLVIGREAKNVSLADAMDYVFGVTCGNDVSARVWQRNDVQWWRAKGADTFGPCGPYIATGLNYDNLLTKLKLNGKVMQEESTSHMINDVAHTVSFISQHVTLHPGDLIFTGTSGKTAAIQPGDVVEVEIEGVGVLRNHVVAQQD